MKYLLDTNICIYYLKGKHSIDQRIKSIGMNNCAISEITVAELKYGIENSQNKEENQKTIESFISSINIIPIISCFDVYAKEKVRLRKSGRIVDDFDLLIGATAISGDFVMVTANEKHFDRMDGIKLENWVKA